MLVSNWVIFGAAEIMALLLVVSVFLLFHARKFKNLSLRLQAKLQLLMQDLKKSKQNCSQLQQALSQSGPQTSFAEMIQLQINETKEHHLTLNPDQDIILDLNTNTPSDRQIASLRHAFLISEKEAALASDDEGKPNWNVLHAKLGKLMNFFRAENKPKSDSAETINNSDEVEELKQALANSEQRIENLEKFKTLFFELEDKWDLAQQQAKACHQELAGFEVGSQQQDNFENLLQRYQDAYNGFGTELQRNTPATGITQIVEVAGNPKPTDELMHLKSVAANQHNLITELQQRLAVAYSAADKEAIIEELKTQLDKQLRYVKESETCIELMDNELTEANKEINRLQDHVDRMELNSSQTAQMIKKANILQEERTKMNKTIQSLEQENEQLVNQLQAMMKSSTSTTSSSESNPAIQKQLLQLQEQYTTLENKYLALRMKS